jgi:hypothetical protein
MSHITRRATLGSLVGLSITSAVRASVPPPPGPLNFSEGVKVERWVELPKNALPMIVARREWEAPEDVLLLASRGPTKDELHWLRRGPGGEALTEPVTGIRGIRRVSAIALANQNQPWVVDCSESGSPRLLGTDGSSSPNETYDLSPVITPTSDLTDLLVDIWGQHRAFISDASGGGAIIVVPVRVTGRSEEADNWKPWRVEGLGRAGEGPASLAANGRDLWWGMKTVKGDLRRSTNSPAELSLA